MQAQPSGSEPSLPSSRVSSSSSLQRQGRDLVSSAATSRRPSRDMTVHRDRSRSRSPEDNLLVTAEPVSTWEPDDTENDIMYMGFNSKDSLELLLPNGRKEVNMKDPYWQTTAGLEKRNAAQTLEFSKLANDKAALRPMSLAESRQVLQRQSQRVLDPRLAKLAVPILNLSAEPQCKDSEIQI